MNIAFACDHGGFPLKKIILAAIKKYGNRVLDFGTNSAESVDFPDYVEKACRAIQQGKAERAIVVCGSGVGACIAANKMKGIYAGICHDTYSAHQGVEHDNMNVLCLGGRIIGCELAIELVNAFLNAKFSNEDRFVRRMKKVRAIEERG
jgi:RpiB/LacA/LacB family sugar-phosphate isomerase